MNSPTQSSLRTTISLTLIAVLSGCLGPHPSPSSNPNSNSVPVEEHSTDATDSKVYAPRSAEDDKFGQLSQAEIGKRKVTLALLEKSQIARSRGNLKVAVTHVERAIRINPRRADLWVQLAQIQLAMDEPKIAEGYARKAIALARDRLDWKRDAWLVIADVKQAEGLTGEADAIRERWRIARG